MNKPGAPLPSFKTSESLGLLIKDLNAWTEGSTDLTFKMMMAAWLDSEETAAMPEKLRNKAESFLARTMPTEGWVVYEHREPETGEVRYVGKGRPVRARSSDRTDPEHSERLKKNELEVVLVKRELGEEEALQEEDRRLIAHRDAGARLYNRAFPDD